MMMVIKQKYFAIMNNIIPLSFVFGLFPAISMGADRTRDFSVELIQEPLELVQFPIQHGRVHSSFEFSLSRFVSTMTPKISYKVSNQLTHNLINLNLVDFPQGFTPINQGFNHCGKVFSLGSQQTCLLTFDVDKKYYQSSAGNDPRICIGSDYCSWPDLGQQANDAVALMPDNTRFDVRPLKQDGLAFEAETFSITGNPTRPGVYSFAIRATNNYQTTAFRQLNIYVGIDEADRPVFKKEITIPSAMPDQEYQLNLLDLLDTPPTHLIHNQVHFKIEPNHHYPYWLTIDPTNGILLQGHVPSSAAGQTQSITLIASSNTGGDSEPITISIPVAFDPAKKPSIASDIHLTSTAGNVIRNNFQSYIKDPSGDGSLQLVIDTIEPQAPWLRLSPSNSLELIGVVPKDAVGQHYQITLHANTATGGNSDSVIIPLDINVNKNLTPRFYAANPQFPWLTVGQFFEHDFVANRDIDPEYKDIPYIVELADGHKNPSWVRIENNKLLIDSVPDHLKQIEQVFITIKNIPGGKSEMFILDLFIMN